MNQALCYCGSKKPFAQCCEPLILGIQKATTAEALMRSRYSAYVVENEAYILQTWHESTRPAGLDFSKKNNDKWLPLTVIASVAGKEKDETGTVEFSTGYSENGTVTPLHETSRFCKEKNVWFYLDGTFQKNSGDAKVGRNDPCSCGSGKKYKKCCGR